LSTQVNMFLHFFLRLSCPSPIPLALSPPTPHIPPCSSLSLAARSVSDMNSFFLNTTLHLFLTVTNFLSLSLSLLYTHVHTHTYSHVRSLFCALPLHPNSLSRATCTDMHAHTRAPTHPFTTGGSGKSTHSRSLTQTHTHTHAQSSGGSD